MKKLQILKIFFEPFLENKKKSFIYFFSVILWVFLVFFNVQFFKDFLDLIENWAEFSEVLKMWIIIVSVIIFWFLLSLFFLKIRWKTEWEMKNFVIQKYLKKYLLLDNEEVDKYWTWKFIWIIWSWIDEWITMLMISLFWITRNILGFVLNLVLIAMINIKLFLPVIIMSILMILWMRLTSNQTTSARAEKKQLFNEIMRNFVKVISEKFTIIKNNKISSEIWKILNLNWKIFEKEISSSFYQEIFMSWSKVILDVMEILLILYTWYLVLEMNASFSEIWVIIFIVWIMRKYLSDFNWDYLHLTNRINSFLNLIETLEEISEIEWYEKWKNFEYKKWEFELKNISFSYKNWKNIFENFSLKISWWKKTALIWKSWSWKSTIIKILMWFVRSQKWEVFVDWQNISDFSLKTFYKNIWYLSQNPWVFDWTVLENLTYWIDNPEKISDEKIKEILDLAECDFVYTLDKWLDTEIWEKWVRLSWWERQRLAIAKLFLENPKIIILDEPTSALDSISEDKISKALNNLSKWKTMIVIAHRLQTVIDSDEIIVFWKNEVLERWSHEKLLENKWFYFEMLDFQSGKIK